MVQCMMCTIKDLGGVAHQRILLLLLWCWNSSHDHHKSPENIVHYANEPFYFQQDGASPHYHRDVRNYLDETLSGQRLKRRYIVEYPPRLPDLTPSNIACGWVPEGCGMSQKTTHTGEYNV
jgi:hypothetical protein